MEVMGDDVFGIISVFVAIFQYLIVLAINIGVIIVSSLGYRERKSRGWLLLIIFGFISLLSNLPSILHLFAARFLSPFTFGRLILGYNLVSIIFRIGSGVLLIVGLFFLAKEYRGLLNSSRKS
jgi:hypothetical protein